jgi:hypothetical protein
MAASCLSNWLRASVRRLIMSVFIVRALYAIPASFYNFIRTELSKLELSTA